jgi:hypothetical protein
MTRRNIIFYDDISHSFYSTPEFNGDKTEMENIRSNDSCDKDWADIIKEFENVKTLIDFKIANNNAQKFYHSSIKDQILPIIRIDRLPNKAKKIKKNIWLLE